MASRIRVATSVTPIYTYSASPNEEADVISGEIGAVLSGVGDLTSPTYAASTALTQAATINGATVISAASTNDGIWIKNLGLDETGAASAATLNVYITADSTIFTKLYSGQAVFLSKPAGGISVIPSSGQLQADYAVFTTV